MMEAAPTEGGATPLERLRWGAEQMADRQRNDEATFAEVGRDLPLEAEHLATAQIALDIGLAVQHLVDPEAVPLDIYPKLWALLFGRFVTTPSAE